MEIVFTDTDELRRYVQGVDGTMSLETLRPAFTLARKAVVDTVGEYIWRWRRKMANLYTRPYGWPWRTTLCSSI